MSNAASKPETMTEGDIADLVSSLDGQMDDIRDVVAHIWGAIESLKAEIGDMQRAFSMTFQQEGKMASPTFVATFADGEVTRMTTHCPSGKLDLGRGVRIARIAYESRKKQPAPAITAGHFEKPDSDGKAVVLKTYSPAKLNAATKEGIDQPNQT